MRDRLGAGGETPCVVPNPRHPIELTSAEAKQLEQLIRAHKTSQSLALRARIILRADAHPEHSNQHLASALGTTDRTVRKWRGRWVKTQCCRRAPQWSAEAFFPLEVRVQVTATAVAYPAGSATLALGVGPNRPGVWPKIRRCHRFLPVPWAAGSKPTAFVPGAITPGSTSMIPSPCTCPSRLGGLRPGAACSASRHLANLFYILQIHEYTHPFLLTILLFRNPKGFL